MLGHVMVRLLPFQEIKIALGLVVQKMLQGMETRYTFHSRWEIFAFQMIDSHIMLHAAHPPHIGWHVCAFCLSISP
jgi:hypothetical protein